LPIIPIGLYFFKNRKNTGQFFIFLYLTLSLAWDLIVNPITIYYTKTEFLGYRIFTIIEYSLCTLFLYKIINNSLFRKLISIASIGLIIFSFFDLVNTNSRTFDSTPTGIVCILIILYSIYYLFEKIRTPDTLFLYSTSNFWIVVALVIFFSGTFFINIFSQSNFTNPKFKATFSAIISVFNILKIFMFSIAFLIKPEKAKPKKAIPIL